MISRRPCPPPPNRSLTAITSTARPASMRGRPPNAEPTRGD
jgi:hypothetical protein